MSCGVMANINCLYQPSNTNCGDNTSSVFGSSNAAGCSLGGPQGADTTLAASGSATMGAPASCRFLFNRICRPTCPTTVTATTVMNRRSILCTVDENTLGGGAGPGLPVELTEFSVEEQAEE